MNNEKIAIVGLGIIAPKALNKEQFWQNVLDGRNCSWAKNAIGMPSVIRQGRRLAIFYDAPAGERTGPMDHEIGLARLDLPLSPPGEAPK